MSVRVWPPARLAVCLLLIGLGAGCGGATGPADTAEQDVTPDTTADTLTDAAADTPDAVAPACPPAPVAPGAVRARPLGCAADLPTGLLVAALPGDLVLENAVARFVVRSRPEGHALAGLTGGHLIDAVRVSDGVQSGDDGLRELVVAVDFWLLAPDTVRVVDDGATGVARVRVEGLLAPFPLLQSVLPLPAPDLNVAHEYVLRPDSPVLEIRTLLTPTRPGPGPSVLVADVTLWGAESRLFVEGLGTDDLPVSSSARLLGLTPALAAPLTPAYAMGTAAARTVLDASGIKAFLFPDTPVPSAGAVVVRHVAVGGTADRDLGASLDAVDSEPAQARSLVSGVVEGAWPGVEVEARDAAGGPLTRCEVGPDGGFECAVPATATRMGLRARGDGNGGPALWGLGGEGSEAALALPGNPDELSLSARSGRLQVRVTDATGAPLPFRLDAWRQTAEGVDERTFHDADGDATFRLPPGTWEVWVHHGPRFTQHHEVLTVGDNAAIEVAATLTQAVQAEGWLATDLHVHAEQSTDSEAANRVRFVAALADDLDIYVATDHDFITQPLPWLEAAGLVGRLQVEAGCEVSTTALGHFNIWPLTADPERSGAGAPAWFDLEAADLLPLLRAHAPGGVVQLNHPRFSGAGYFDVINLSASRLAGGEIGPALLDFDALELVNGIAHGSTPEVLADWMMLLDQGIRRTGTGASDVHGASDPMGLPGTLVRPAGEDVWTALVAGRAIVSAGPMLTLSLWDGPRGAAETSEVGIGEVLSPAAGATVTARVELQSPDWMPLGRLELVCAGETLLDEAVDGVQPEGLRHRVVREVVLPPGDAWCVAIHHPGLTPRPGLRRPPWAITNPAFVDADGDGDWVR